MESKSFETVLDRFRTIELHESFDVIVAIANGGIIPAGILNQRLQLDFQLLKIHYRDPSQQPEYEHPVLVEPLHFSPAGKRILLVEDRVKTGASLQLAVRLLNEAGASLVKTFAVNGKADYCLYDETCFRFPWIIS
jgi:xanthine phosphoribosyltransferase